MSSPEPTRLSSEIDAELHHRFRECIPHGMRSAVIRNLVRMAVNIVTTARENDQEHVALAILLSSDIGLAPKEPVQNSDSREKAY